MQFILAKYYSRLPTCKKKLTNYCSQPHGLQETIWPRTVGTQSMADWFYNNTTSQLLLVEHCGILYLKTNQTFLPSSW